MMDQMNVCQGGIISSLSHTIDEILQPLLPRGTACALLDFPDHSNVGDSAIWLGETRWLRRNGVKIVYACSYASYSPDRLSKLLGDGVILMHGGGNLGDFWIDHQRFREQVI